MAMNLHLLRLFATVARSGSFSKAAEMLSLSQPSISKGVRDFELQLGCRLLDRSSKGVTPTREGVALLRHADILFAAERSAEEELRALRGLDAGSLRIGASTTIATYLIPEYVGAFHVAHPGIELQLVSANTRDIAELMLRHEIEVALVEGPVEIDGLESEPWLTDVMDLIAGPQHPLAMAPSPIEPARIADEIFIFREIGSGSREVVMQALAAQGVEPVRTLDIGSTEAIKQLVAAGLGVSMVSRAGIKDQVALNRLKPIAVRGFHLERMLWKLKVPGRIEIPAAVAFEQSIASSVPSAPRRAAQP